MISSYRAAANDSNNVPTDPKRAAEIMMDAIGDNLVEIFFAGFNTSVVGMCVSLYYLAQDRQLMREAQMEVDSVIPDDVDFATTLSSKQFPFLCRVFQEALRVVPPAPLVVRQTTDELSLDEVKIPAGTVTWFPAAFLHKDPQSWGSTVDQFDPSRWEKPTIPGSYIPFSGGPRECIGKHFAELESVVGLAVLLRTFDFDIDPDYKFMPFFSGFGYRTANAADMKVCMNLIPKRRTDVSAFMHDWTPVRIPRRNSNPLFAGCDDDELPRPPKFD
jgi:cytochrome P450